jgi:hypothetical protein
MKWIKMTGLAAVAVSLLALSAEQAAAQPQYTPTLSVVVNGNSATIQWTRVNEAEGYTVQAGYAPGAPLASQSFPASITGGTLNGVPNGVYYLRVRAYAGPYVGPWSNEVQVVVGGPVGCTADAPTAGAQVNGPVVTIGWSGVGAAIGYQVQYSRYSGITELAQNVGPGTLSHQQYVPFLGTFYARVLTQNSCGQQMVSNEVAFTITDLTGNGPRTPDPPPGQMLPLPSYGQAVSLQVAAAYPGDLANACNSRSYLFKLVRELRKYDTRWGLNYKRGWVETSKDVISYNGTSEPDNGADHIYLVDVVLGICDGPNGWNWDTSTTDKTWGAAGSSECGTFWCAKWTLDAYLAAGYPLYPIP